MEKITPIYIIYYTLYYLFTFIFWHIAIGTVILIIIKRTKKPFG